MFNACSKCMHSTHMHAFAQMYISVHTFNLPYMGKLLRLVHKITIRGKTFAVDQAMANMYCTQQVIQGENFRD